MAALQVAIGCETVSNQQLDLEPKARHNNYQTENLVIVVIDGPRFKETWGDPTKSNIPFLANELAEVGIHYNRFYNRGATYTTSGHAAVTTGNYQWMSNDGSEIPFYPSIFQLWLSNTGLHSNQVQIITSKEKLRVLSDCVDPKWRGKFNPMVNAVNREDHETLKEALTIMQQHHPKLALIHFRGPDFYGHANHWENYINSIKETDRYTYDIWEYLQRDSVYRDKTTLVVTNDHGRHHDTVRDGFVSHGDFCEGCMHINFYTTGPDFHSNLVVNQPRQIVDLSATIAEIMGFKLPTSSGSIMWELFKE